MRKTIFTLFISILTIYSSFSQTVVNPDFEDWDSITYQDPDIWENGNRWTINKLGKPMVTRITDAVSGTYAIQIETLEDGGDNIGFIMLGDPEAEGERLQGGIPYSQKPAAIEGYFKYDIKAGDTAMIIVQFKENGTVISNTEITFTGTQISYTYFSYNLQNYTDGKTPDTVIIAFASSNPWSDSGQAKGSLIMLDSIVFSGTGITQPIPNGDFEDWTEKKVYILDGWYSDEGVLSKETNSSDVHSSLASAKITSMNGGWYEEDSVSKYYIRSRISTGKEDCENDSCIWSGGTPLAVQEDTLYGYYKYTPAASSDDSGLIDLNFEKQDTSFYYVQEILAATSTFIKFAVPFDLTGNPADTVIISLSSSKWPAAEAYIGSQLWVDYFYLASTGGVGIKENSIAKTIRIYPNPAQDKIYLRFLQPVNSNISVKLLSINGQTIFSQDLSQFTGVYENSIDLTNCSKGIYLLQITNDKESFSKKIVVR